MKQKQNKKEAKQKIIWKQNKAKYTLYSFRFDRKQKIRSKKKRKKIQFSRERAKRMRSGSRFTSFCFEKKKKI
jgi:hypothetical protein